MKLSLPERLPHSLLRFSSFILPLSSPESASATAREVTDDMPELIRSFASRLRELVGNRRRAPRYRVRLEVELALNISQAGGKSHSTTAQLKLAGYTRDISESGLAVIVPAIRIGGQYFTDSNHKLLVTLRLPDDIVIELHAKPVRYVPLEDDATETGYLIGLAILEMSANDRRRFKDYIETLNAER